MLSLNQDLSCCLNCRYSERGQYWIAQINNCCSAQSQCFIKYMLLTMVSVQCEQKLLPFPKKSLCGQSEKISSLVRQRNIWLYRVWLTLTCVHPSFSFSIVSQGNCRGFEYFVICQLCQSLTLTVQKLRIFDFDAFFHPISIAILCRWLNWQIRLGDCRLR